MPLKSGSRMGTYEIKAPLGAGGMGEVYRARDLRLGREVALKVLPEEMSADADLLARFEREARTVAGINHPNIVTLYSIEDDQGVRFLTMELIEGQPLDQVVTPGGLAIARVIELGIPLADALAAAHEKGVVHRDLKPANVMLTKDGRLKVLDFGLAKFAGPHPDLAWSSAGTVDMPLSGTGMILGTAPYMAPEQIRGEPADARTDLFALGIVLYELASGTRPFPGKTYADVTSAILRDTPAPLGSLRGDLPRDLERLVSGCLEKDPRERVQTALDVSNALRRLRKDLERTESGLPPGPATDQVASIAVLPFANRSASVDDEYFSDGLADELLSVLSKIKGLRVTARTSSFQFKGTKDDVPAIGRKLNVATLLEGSVRKAGNRIRVSVQLVNVADSSHLWSETYDRTLEDIFAVQDDIAQSVVKELRTALLGEAADSDAAGAAKAEVVQAARGRGTDPEAHRLYLLAKHLVAGLSDDTAQTITYLKEALARDPGYALAWADLSLAYAREADRGRVSMVEGYARAREAVERALALEPDLAEGHARLGWIRAGHDWDWQGAEASYARALELSPGDSDALRMRGVLACARGRLEEAIGFHRRALEQNPLSSGAYLNLGFVLYVMDRFAESEAAYRKALELAPHGVLARGSLALTLLELGQGEESLAEALREPHAYLRLYVLSIVYHGLGHAAESDAALHELIEKHAEGAAFQVAEAYGARGQVDASFEWLERAYRQRDSGLTAVKASRCFRAFHGDPRWGAFVKKMKLDD